MSLLHSQPAPLLTPSYVDSLTDDEFEDIDDDDLSLHGLDDEPDPFYQPGIDVCIVCRKRPPYSKGGKKYPTCGLTCAGVLETALSQHTPLPPSPSSRNGSFFSFFGSHRGRGGTPSTSSRTSGHLPGAFAPSPQSQYPQPHYSPRPRQLDDRPRDHHALDESTRVQYVPPQRSRPCVICKASPCYGRHVTCGVKCTEKLFTNGPPDPRMCNYCHRRPKVSGHDQCGDTCKASAKVACLLCKSRPKHKSYHLCGKTCKEISVKSTPLLLEAPPGHVSRTMVENKFKTAYPGGPAIKHVYKIIENKSFLQPYDAYKKRVGNEVFRYHGTKRCCTLGSNGNTKLCSGGCNLCSILRTSFKTSLAANGWFGRGIYSSSSAQTASGYMGGNGGGAMILTKVVLGKIWNVSNPGAAMAPPAGYDSVVFNPPSLLPWAKGTTNGNETVVYTDDAIRPVFLIIF